MRTLNPSDREERLEDHAGFQFKVTSYRLGDGFKATATNVDPGAVIARAEGETREAAVAGAMRAAKRRLERTRVRTGDG